MSPIIVIPAYSRPTALKRLLSSIVNSDIPRNSVQIIISLDGGFLPSVEMVAEDFIAQNSDLQINLIKRKANIGLKKHILWCGDLTKEYSSVIILEDDLIVSKDFYQYASEALAFYKHEDTIAGISLYAQRYNEYANLPFEPMPNGYDTYFMQIASSWGQAWTSAQWASFRAWFDSVNADDLKLIYELPSQVSSWPETSWKKYFSAYLVVKEKYFIYPYISRTSNCADEGGQHTTKQINYLQTPISLDYYFSQSYNFTPTSFQCIKYDAFMEAVIPHDKYISGYLPSEVTIDLYGLKPKALIEKHSYVVTSKQCKAYLVAFPIKYRPIENNILLPVNFPIENRNPFLFLCHKDKVIYKPRIHKYFRLVEYFSYLRLKSKKFSLSYLLSHLK